MLGLLSHRGNGPSGTYLAEGVALGARATLPPTQPLGADHVRVVIDGTILNHRELRRALEEEGIQAGESPVKSFGACTSLTGRPGAATWGLRDRGLGRSPSPARARARSTRHQAVVLRASRGAGPVRIGIEGPTRQRLRRARARLPERRRLPRSRIRARSPHDPVGGLEIAPGRACARGLDGRAARSVLALPRARTRVGAIRSRVGRGVASSAPRLGAVANGGGRPGGRSVSQRRSRLEPHPGSDE